MTLNCYDCESNDVEYKGVNAMIFNRSDCESKGISMQCYSIVLLWNQWYFNAMIFNHSGEYKYVNGKMFNRSDC